MKKCVLSILLAMSIVAVACAGENAKSQSNNAPATEQKEGAKTSNPYSSACYKYCITNGCECDFA